MSLRNKMRQQRNCVEDIVETDGPEVLTPAPIISDEKKVNLTPEEIVDFLAISGESTEETEGLVIGVDMAEPGADKTVKPGSRESASGYGNIDGPKTTNKKK